MEVSVTGSIGCGFAFETRFPATLCLAFSREKWFLTFRLRFVNSIHNSNPRNFSVSKQGFDTDFDTVTFLMKADFNMQDRADFRVFENPPSHSGCFSASRQRILLTVQVKLWRAAGVSRRLPGN